MNKKIIAASFLVIAILIVSAIGGTAFYYDSAINNGNSKIASLNDKIANLNYEISNLNGQISSFKNFTVANLVTALGITEVPSDSSHNYPGPLPYNHLYISGQVNNLGDGTAFNAGLHILAYAANGTLEVNMTVPLGGGNFGTDAGTEAFVSSSYGNSSLQLESSFGGEKHNFIYKYFSRRHCCFQLVVTPVWTNSS